MRYQLPPSFLKKSSHKVLGDVARKSWQRLRLHLFGGWPLHARVTKSAKFRLGHGGFASRRGFACRRGFEKRAHRGYKRACNDSGI